MLSVNLPLYLCTDELDERVKVNFEYLLFASTRLSHTVPHSIVKHLMMGIDMVHKLCSVLPSF